MGGKRIPTALTIGDPAGIGPEITADLVARGPDSGADLYLVGPAAVLEAALVEAGAPCPPVVAVEKILAGFVPDRFPVIVDVGAPGETYPAGGPSPAGGAVSGRAIETAAAMVRRGIVEGIVTGPVSKEALHLAGLRHCSHTEMLAELLHAPECQMMMVAGRLRIVIMTRDMPLRQVPAAVTGERIVTCVRVTDAALRGMWGIERPVISVAALNPHAGDGGVTGTEEREVIVPALEALRAEGIDARGPLPADTLFCRALRREGDAIVALYHDQGMIPFKMSGFEAGVNMTIGLPAVRTSVCHGTAYDIAGTGAAGSGSLRAALDLAVACCRTRAAERAV